MGKKKYTVSHVRLKHGENYNESYMHERDLGVSPDMTRTRGVFTPPFLPSYQHAMHFKCYILHADERRGRRRRREGRNNHPVSS